MGRTVSGRPNHPGQDNSIWEPSSEINRPLPDQKQAGVAHSGGQYIRLWPAELRPGDFAEPGQLRSVPPGSPGRVSLKSCDTVAEIFDQRLRSRSGKGRVGYHGHRVYPGSRLAHHWFAYSRENHWHPPGLSGAELEPGQPIATAPWELPRLQSVTPEG